MYAIDTIGLIRRSLHSDVSDGRRFKHTRSLRFGLREAGGGGTSADVTPLCNKRIRPDECIAHIVLRRVATACGAGRGYKRWGELAPDRCQYFHLYHVACSLII